MRYLQNLPIVSWVQLISMDFLNGGWEGGPSLVGSRCQCALDVGDVRSLEKGLYQSSKLGKSFEISDIIRE